MVGQRRCRPPLPTVKCLIVLTASICLERHETLTDGAVNRGVGSHNWFHLSDHVRVHLY